MSIIKISAEDMARIFDPSLRDPQLEATRLATLARIRHNKEKRQQQSK